MLELFSNITDGATVVTATQRLARVTLSQYARWQQEQGQRTWRSAVILPWSAWLRRLYEHAADAEVGSSSPPLSLLAAAQEQYLWEAIVRRSPSTGQLLQTRRTAQLAHDAWILLRQWRIPVEPHRFQAHEDSAAFLQWGQTYSEQCAAQAWLDSAGLPNLLADWITSGRLAVPETLIIAGFDEITPQQRGFLECLTAQGCNVTLLPLPHLGATVRRFALTDINEEINVCARWARQCLEQDNACRVGIVVPDLARLGPHIERQFDDILNPGALLPDAAATPRVFNSSMGTRLVEKPLITVAAMILRLTQGHLTLDEFGLLLRSPFIDSADSEASARALFDARLREMGEPRITLPLIVHLVNRGPDDTSTNMPQLAECLTQFSARLEACAAQATPAASPAEWMVTFSELLATWGWPGNRPLSSDEHQALAAWWKLVDHCTLLETVAGSINLEEARGLLLQAAQQQLFQAEAPEVPIQIMGTLEAAGLSFDHLWVMGLNDQQWPASVAPNPFIPIAVQRQYQLPRASMERELAYAKSVTERLIQSAPDVVLSYPEHKDDQAFQASPLIVAHPTADISPLALPPVEDFKRMIFEHRDIEFLTDDQAPPVDLAHPTAGGAALFRDQAACPFRAFAIHRLGARPLGQGAMGLDAAQRGTLLHCALQSLWSSLQDHATLMSLSKDALNQRIRQAVNSAVAASKRHYEATFTQRFTSMEQQRLAHALHNWLAIDCQRMPFTVAEQETVRTLEIGGLSVQLRIDRIDRITDHHYAIIDYKTGQTKISAWMGERPDEPQLPLYAVALGDGCAALAFAQLRTGDYSYKGLTDGSELGAGLVSLATTALVQEFPNWSTLLDHWRSVLTQLALEYRQGNATVDPKERGKSCLYCALDPVCRINTISTRSKLN